MISLSSQRNNRNVVGTSRSSSSGANSLSSPSSTPSPSPPPQSSNNTKKQNNKKLSSTSNNGSGRHRHMTVHDLKKVRKARQYQQLQQQHQPYQTKMKTVVRGPSSIAIATPPLLSNRQMNDVISNLLLQIPEHNEALFYDPPLDHLQDIDLMDDYSFGGNNIFKDKDKYNESFHTTTSRNSSIGQEERRVGGRTSGPVDLDDSVDDSTDDESVTSPTTRRIGSSGPVDLDDSIITDGDSTVGNDESVIISFETFDTTVPTVITPNKPPPPPPKDPTVPVNNEDVVNDGLPVITPNKPPPPSEDGTDVTDGSSLISMDNIIYERSENFDMIWKEHEDEFLVWKSGSQHRKMNHNSMGAVVTTSASLTANNKYIMSGESSRTGYVNELYNINLPVTAKAAAATSEEIDLVGEDDDMSSKVTSSSLDTFGYPTGFPNTAATISSASLLPLNTSVVGIAPPSSPLPNPVVTPPSSEQQRQQQETYRNNVDGKQEEQETKRGDERIDNEPSYSSLASKARHLRALRLRAAIDGANNRARLGGSPVEEEKESSSILVSNNVDYPSHYGHVIQVTTRTRSNNNINNNTYRGGDEDNNSGDGDGTQSVISEITNISGKLFIKVDPKQESKWDDMSSVGFCVVERPQQKRQQRPATTTAAAAVDVYRILNVDDFDAAESNEEVSGYDTDTPPLSFDGSVKTPPLCYLLNHNSSKAGLEQQGNDNVEEEEEICYQQQDDAEEYSLTNKWNDDVSSIGLLGAEQQAMMVMNKKRNKTFQSTTMLSGNNNSNSNNNAPPMIPFVIRPRQDYGSNSDDDNYNNNKNRNSSNINSIFRERGEESVVFKECDGFKQARLKPKSTSADGDTTKPSGHLELNQTFSTVWVEDCDSYLSPVYDCFNDLEMQHQQQQQQQQQYEQDQDQKDEIDKVSSKTSAESTHEHSSSSKQESNCSTEIQNSSTYADVFSRYWILVIIVVVILLVSPIVGVAIYVHVGM
ncbi:hypothetical protein FRACYDRAFT_237356 [Fragilariopsis cylindrus CCMP1102]|uniref:Uncharacterized protein n=1 Tax=Fragilariopsis cylindrus CCMP1102 TaxID=635003 RepID=A0A1E7FLX0_9STRA|nr:hypothetical protein FRACYDRAFT_237356 [Fragilariopsis cylindrus CCMP1102]|eukprot:OEU19065.1 hypothetical protein FRACYDRAFT_237356 [Fragilariopsis cylindrus CCMP1102]